MVRGSDEGRGAGDLAERHVGVVGSLEEIEAPVALSGEGVSQKLQDKRVFPRFMGEETIPDWKSRLDNEKREREGREEHQGGGLQPANTLSVSFGLVKEASKR